MNIMKDEPCDTIYTYVQKVQELRKELADMILENRKLSTENMKLKFELTKLKNS